MILLTYIEPIEACTNNSTYLHEVYKDLCKLAARIVTAKKPIKVCNHNLNYVRTTVDKNNIRREQGPLKGRTRKHTAFITIFLYTIRDVKHRFWAFS